MAHLSYSNLDTRKPVKGRCMKMPPSSVLAPTEEKCMCTHRHTTVFPTRAQMKMFVMSHALLSSRQKEWKQLDPWEEQPLEVTNSLSNIKITDTYHQNCLAQKQGATADCMFQLKADKQRLQNWSSQATLGLVPPTILLSQRDHQYLLGPNLKGGRWVGGRALQKCSAPAYSS